MKFFAIGDETMVAGFNLVGVDGIVVEGADDALEALDKALNSKDVGIVIVSERIASQIQERIEEYTFTHTFPLIIEVPDRTGPVEGRTSIRDLVRSAVGFNV
ncbi:Vacuolar H+transporting two-sector ATPase F subunit [bacterium]|nr:MAG: Vacuolar H+transporting two-sector ATPase F subunit [bacterium]